MRWNQGVTRCARLANSPFGEDPLYSKSPPSETPKLMSEGCAATCSDASNRSKLG
jgi:hypothetical protein